MWATCCNWFCLNGQPEDLPHRPASATRAYANAGYTSFPSPTGPEATCKACETRFPSTSLKNVCLDCKNTFCAACAHQPESGPCLCHLCHRVRATDFCWEELMKMKVKDLRSYLELREISTAMCCEKEELVCLIISKQQQPPPGPEGDQLPQVPPPTTVPEAQGERLPTPATLDCPIEQDTTEPTTATMEAEEVPQANGHAVPDQDMAEVDNGVEMLNEDETQSTDSEDNQVPGRRASLSDLTSVRDISALSVRQLKEILARNFVNYKGCCEKWELMERVMRLYKEKDLQQLGILLQKTPGSKISFSSLFQFLTQMIKLLRQVTLRIPAWRTTSARSAWTPSSTASSWSAATWSPAPSAGSA
ncbi:E3 ubiquitin-protein ligase rififylin isoform X2 [Sceloporus undulatus]|uniref:E3 ubiquitin-protein ligase rififylin isoform X2 n=1 Tax=Sceloporus undulatus TaxID=8520 RepID=UPI001C4AAC49|nr:E3 ubiquitin-protein ligase rififylin isoform X2 [Sceloporus undulatus]